MKPILLLAIPFILFSCSNKDLDNNGNLLAEKLESGSGIHFTPMETSDSADVNETTPVLYKYKNKPYTGKIVSYYEADKLQMEANLNDGLLDGDFKYYFPSGVVQIEGKYNKGRETGMWYSYLAKDKPGIIKYYDNNGYMLMRKEFYDKNKLKNYQNVRCPEFGNIERSIEFKFNGEIEYIDAEREVGKLSPKEIHDLLVMDGLFTGKK